MKKVLMIAYHFPPLAGSSGILRTLKFAKYLPDFGWQPIVMTVTPSAYPARQDAGQEDEVGAGIVRRIPAFDTARHLAIKGRYARWMALPDRWASWAITGTVGGLRLIQDQQPAVVWTTYPIATAHLLGLLLRRLAGLPWVADFRDSMTEDGFPREPRRRRLYRWIERRTVAESDVSVFTAPRAIRMYSGRYPDIPAARWVLIRNGFDDSDFQRAAGPKAGDRQLRGRRAVLVHSGLLYRSERDPRAFFAAVGNLRRSGEISAHSLGIVLRASGDEAYHRASIESEGISDIVSLEPGVSYPEAVAEMLSADGLLLFQAANCNHQIPAKLYEYFRAGKPILALTDPQGDTADTIREAGIGTIVPLDSVSAIEHGLRNFLRGLAVQHTSPPAAPDLSAYERRAQAARLGALFDELAAKQGKR